MGLFLQQRMGAPEGKRQLRDDHFSVDDMLLQADTCHTRAKKLCKRI